MTSEGVQTIISGGAMVKAVNRKPRTFQTPGEKVYSLEEHNTRLRERLLLVNRFEEARLERLQRQITTNERANIGRILRRKDQSRVTLINIASTRRKLQANVGDFERRLKNGTNSPVFTVELERIRRREQELSGLRSKLQAPNSQLLAAHVRDELRNIESRLDANTNSTNPPSVAGSYAHVKLNNEKEPGTSLISGNHSELETMPANSSLDKLVNEVHDKMSQANISPPSPKNVTQVPNDQERNFPLTQPLEQNKMEDQLETAIAISAQSRDKPLSLKLEDIPEKPEDIPERRVVAVALPKRELPPLRVTKNKKQKYLSLMQQKLVRTPIRDRDHEISHSALKRERHALQRVAELRVKTREDIQGQRTADSDDSLGSIKQQEAVTRLKTSWKGVGGSQLPSVGREEHAERSKPRENMRVPRKRPGKRRGPDSSAAPVGVKLPPIRIDIGILKELKESRLRHRNQSKKLPKLP